MKFSAVICVKFAIAGVVGGGGGGCCGVGVGVRGEPLISKTKSFKFVRGLL